MTKKFKQTHRLFVRKLISKGTDQFGREYIKSQWIEVPEASLGSKNKPNKEIMEFAFVPIEDDEDRNRTLDNSDINDIIRRFFHN